MRDALGIFPIPCWFGFHILSLSALGANSYLGNEPSRSGICNFQLICSLVFCRIYLTTFLDSSKWRKLLFCFEILFQGKSSLISIAGLFGQVQLCLSVALGQLIKSGLYDEIEAEFVRSANFLTRDGEYRTARGELCYYFYIIYNLYIYNHI